MCAVRGLQQRWGWLPWPMFWGLPSFRPLSSQWPTLSPSMVPMYSQDKSSWYPELSPSDPCPLTSSTWLPSLLSCLWASSQGLFLLSL